MSLTAAMWADSPAPPELLRYRLMEKFGWTPQELDTIPWMEVQNILTVISVEAKIQKRRESRKR